MAVTDQRVEYVSFAPLFGENSMETFLQALTEDRHCLDCKTAIEALEGGMVFGGHPPGVELIGHLCDDCWEWRERVRRLRHEKVCVLA
jgi:hypothetical protein